METVAVGFWVAGRYSGPRDSEGAWGWDSDGIFGGGGGSEGEEGGECRCRYQVARMRAIVEYNLE